MMILSIVDIIDHEDKLKEKTIRKVIVLFI